MKKVTADRGRKHGRPRWVWWVAASLTLVLGLVAIGTWIVPRVLYGDSGPQEVQPADREVLITLEDLDPGRQARSASESCTRYGSSAPLGFVDLSDHYDEFGNDIGDVLTIRSEVYAWGRGFLGSSQLKADVLWSVLSERFDEDSAWSSPGSASVTVRRLADLNLGDESLCAVAFRGEEPVGFSFRCRVGARILTADVHGHGFDDRAAAEAFLAPHVERLREYRP